MSINSIVERRTFSTTNCDEAHAFFRDTYVDHRLTYAPAREDFRVAVCAAKAGDISGGHMRAAMRYGSQSEPDDTLLMALLAGGRLEYRSRMDESVCRSGDTFAVPHNECGDALMHDPDIFNLLVPMERITQIARVNFGPPREPFTFYSVNPISPAMNWFFGRTIRMVAEELISPEGSVFEFPLIARQLVDVAVTALLNGFANSTMSADYGPQPGSCGPAAVRRAADYIDEHAGEPISVSDIADATGADARELQATFTRDHGVTPTEYLRRVRLKGAHHDLQARTPAGGDTVATVSAIARRWGFANPRLFAALYRATYGRAPGVTLGEDPA